MTSKLGPMLSAFTSASPWCYQKMHLMWVPVSVPQPVIYIQNKYIFLCMLALWQWYTCCAPHMHTDCPNSLPPLFYMRDDKTSSKSINCKTYSEYHCLPELVSEWYIVLQDLEMVEAKMKFHAVCSCTVLRLVKQTHSSIDHLIICDMTCWQEGLYMHSHFIYTQGVWQRVHCEESSVVSYCRFLF